MKTQHNKRRTMASRTALSLRQRGASQRAQLNNPLGRLPLEGYSDKQIAELDRLDEELKIHLQRK